MSSLLLLLLLLFISGKRQPFQVRFQSDNWEQSADEIAKGQLISKGLFTFLKFFQKKNETIHS